MNYYVASFASLHALFTPLQDDLHIRDLQKAYVIELFRHEWFTKDCCAVTDDEWQAIEEGELA